MGDYKGEIAMICGTAVVVAALVLGYDGALAASAVAAFFGTGGFIVGRKKT